MRKAGVFFKSNERILGSSDFVDAVLAGAQEALDQKYTLAAKGIGFSHIVSAVSELTSIPFKDLVGPCKERTIVKARIIVCYWSVTELGMSMTELGKKLGIAVSTVSGAVPKGSSRIDAETVFLFHSYCAERVYPAVKSDRSGPGSLLCPTPQ